MKKILRRNGLSLTVFFLFAVFWAGQLYTGWLVDGDERRKAGDPLLPFLTYVRSPHAVEASAENWESEFLQMCAFAVLTAFLFQRGSAESRNPDRQDDEGARKISDDAPWPVKRGGWVLKVYEHSLSLSLGVLFLASFVLHVKGGKDLYNEEQVRHGDPTLSSWQFLGSSQFWFESLQNWQSEFLSIGAMVVLSIFLREKGSPESKRVETPHHSHDD